MKGRESEESVRLKRVLLNDSLQIPNGVLQVMKKDVQAALSSYFELEEDSLTVEVLVDGEGRYLIKTEAKGFRAKPVKIL